MGNKTKQYIYLVTTIAYATLTITQFNDNKLKWFVCFACPTLIFFKKWIDHRNKLCKNETGKLT